MVTPVQGPSQTPASVPPRADALADGNLAGNRRNGSVPVRLGLDLTQMALDLTGIVDPTPISDGGDAIISVGRSIGSAVSGNWSEAGGHLGNGGLSALGIIPVLGDLAKAGKIGKWAQTVADATSAIARNPALRATLEPTLRQINDLIGRIPAGVLDKLPASARESIERMKTQLDEFSGGPPAVRTMSATPPPCAAKLSCCGASMLSPSTM